MEFIELPKKGVKVMKEWILRRVAKKNGTTVEEVRRSIDEALSEAFNNSTPGDTLSTDFKNGQPTAEEFLEYARRRIRGE
jgi:hypothetical protein